MKQSKVAGAFVLAIIIVAIAAIWTMRTTESSLEDETEQTINRSKVIDDELFEPY